MTLPKTRLDDYLVQAGFALDKKEAQAMILAGEVRIKGNPAKPSDIIKEIADVDYRPRAPFVSRGGEKLRGALKAFQINVQGLSCMDIGSSTGGFTECLLKEGAKDVYAIDVGRGLLDIKLRNDPRVHVHEGVNIRNVEPSLFGSVPLPFAVVDVSFISLQMILPKVAALLSSKGYALVLVKPQFEGTPKEVPGGFVKDEVTRQTILARVHLFVEDSGFEVKAVADADIKGRKGNQETFFYLLKHPA